MERGVGSKTPRPPTIHVARAVLSTAGMPGPLAAYMEADHERIDRLLDHAVADPNRFDHDAFERFRAALLRHIGIEEKILLPDARRRCNGVPLPIASILRREHGALASLLVPTPDHALVGEIRAILTVHNPREEGLGGLYETCERLAGDEVRGHLERAEAAPEVPTARHHDGPRATRSAAAALQRNGTARKFEPVPPDQDR